MATTSPHQLLLLADHIKLSLLERQRAQSLDLPAKKQDTSIRRSLAALRDGIASLERQKFDQDAAGEEYDLRCPKLQLHTLTLIVAAPPI